MRVKQVDVSVLCHATEDPEKLRAALSFLTGSERIAEENLEGVYGEPITLMRVKQEGKPAEQLFERITSDPDNKKKLLDDLELRLEGWKLHVRLDKQELVKGRISIGSGDNTIKLVVVAGGKAEKGGSKGFFAASLGGNIESH